MSIIKPDTELYKTLLFRIVSAISAVTLGNSNAYIVAMIQWHSEVFKLSIHIPMLHI